MTGLGLFLQKTRAYAALWLSAFIAFLCALLAINMFFRPVEPHFIYDVKWGFWAAFGFGAGIVMVFVMKRIIQPLIARKEDYYGDI